LPGIEADILAGTGQSIEAIEKQVAQLQRAIEVCGSIERCVDHHKEKNSAVPVRTTV
jgi:hypothetical protein